jgi:hypothetical protein
MTASTVHYDETKARRWLSWLAREMQRRGTTVFMIEDLQPACLPGRLKYSAYVAASRFVAIALALAPSVAVAAWQNWDDDFAAFIVVTGFAVWAVAVCLALLDARGGDMSRSRRVVRALSGALVGVIVAAVVAYVEEESFADGAVALAFLGAGVAIGRPRRPAGDIQVIESLRWSSRRGIPAVGLGIGLIVWAVVGTWSQRGDKFDFSDIFIAMAFLAALLLGLWGFKPGLPGLKVAPNQGIRTTAKYAARVGAAVFLIAAVPFFVLDTSTTGIRWLDPFPTTGRREFVAIAFLVSGIAAMLLGGKEVVRHFTLRVMLWLSGALPFRLARFLDYAAGRLQILQKVGGGYIFVHRLLLEHFAEQRTGSALLGTAATVALTALLAAGPDASGPVRDLPAVTSPGGLAAVPLIDGDVIFRAGRSLDSRLIRFADDGSPYSHVGLIDRREGTPFVVHVEPDVDGGGGRVRREPLGDFLAASKSDGFAVYRVTGDRTGVAAAALTAALGYQAAGVTFDRDFDLETAGAMYCSELVWRAFLAAGVDLTHNQLDGTYPLGPRRAVRLSRLLGSADVSPVAVGR